MRFHIISRDSRGIIYEVSKKRNFVQRCPA